MGICFGREGGGGGGTTPPPGDPSTVKKDGKRLLLVGAGDSGKSTIFKQLKRLYAQGFQQDELQNLRPYILDNVSRNMINLCYATQQTNIQIESENIERRDLFAGMYADPRASMANAKKWNANTANDFKLLWQDQGIKKAFRQYRATYQVEDGAPYYFDKIEELANPEWIPLEEDILRTRIKTVGLVEQPFVCDGTNFSIIDVGGQRNERKKWLRNFEDVDAIIYVCSLSEFDQSCYEDGTTNRMIESLSLFDSYISSDYFKTSLVYLVMNKQDLFEEKINHGIKLQNTFSEYAGSDVLSAKQYIEDKYKGLDTSERLRSVMYLTALDRAKIKEMITFIIGDIQRAENEVI